MTSIEQEANPHQGSSSGVASPLLHRTSGKRGVSSDLGRVRVIVRCRPLTNTEHGHTCQRISTEGDAVVVGDETDSANGSRRFVFDRVLSSDADQVESFTEVAPLVDRVLDGYHATVFAYGQTGSGKTYTMEGLNYYQQQQHELRNSKLKNGPTSSSEGVEEGDVVVPDLDATPLDQHGIMPRTIQLLFDKACERQGKALGSEQPRADSDDNNNNNNNNDGEEDGGVAYSFKCSFYQIYNERISDLLRPTVAAAAATAYGTRGVNRSRSSGGKSTSRGSGMSNEGLRVRWHSGDTFQVENLFKYECDNPQKMREALFSGVKEKVMGSHLMNRQSSRSHCVFTIYVDCRNAKNGEVISRSELSLVDLAGSEKLGQLSAAPSARLVKESIEINTSLLALGKVITALAQRSKDAKSIGHVPYRDSKLTKLLKHALGGNSVTVMLACISSSDHYVDESISTLMYAGRATNIENIPRMNEDPTQALIRQLRAEVKQLKQELSYYRALATESLATRAAAVSTMEGSAHGTSSGTGSASSSSQRTQTAEQLADSLLSACGMLQSVMGVNGQLREAYDAVKEAKIAAEQREVQLNAENIALRERIEMLESIALNTEFVETTADDAVGVPEKTTAGVHAWAERKHEAEEEDDEEDQEESSPADAPVSVKVMEKVKTQQINKPSTSTLEPSEGESTDTAFMEDAHTTQTSSSARAPSKSSRSLKQHHHATAAATSGATRKKTQKRKRKLIKKLEEYEHKYRAPTKTETYADYYGRATAQVPQNNKVNQAIKEMEETLKKLPREVVADFVPASLRSVGMFGALAFGGGEAETNEFEAKRKDREARREALLRKQQELYLKVQRELIDARDEHEAAKRSMAVASTAPPAFSPFVSTGRSSGSGRTTADRSGRGTEAEGVWSTSYSKQRVAATLPLDGKGSFRTPYDMQEPRGVVSPTPPNGSRQHPQLYQQRAFVSYQAAMFDADHQRRLEGATDVNHSATSRSTVSTAPLHSSSSRDPTGGDLTSMQRLREYLDRSQQERIEQVERQEHRRPTSSRQPTRFLPKPYR